MIANGGDDTMGEFEGSKRSGRFTIAASKDIYGELAFAGPDTILYLQDKEPFETHAIPGSCVHGTLNDLTKVSLINCNIPPAPGFSRRNSGEYYFTEIFPHFVILGDHHVDPEENAITHVWFVIDDASILFYDFDAFGSVIDSRPYIEQVVHANRLQREIPLGHDTIILYFTGKREIFSADTVFGRISASHHPIHTMSGPNGVSLKNTIFVTLAFREKITFDN